MSHTQARNGSLRDRARATTAESPVARLLVLTELFLPTKGGTAVWFDELYRRLGTKAIHVITADVPGAREHDREHPNSIHRLKLQRHAWIRPESLVMYCKFLVRGARLAAACDFEAVHAGRVLPEGLVGLALARLKRRPLVVFAHGEEITTWRQPLKFRAMKAVYCRADLVVANSEFTRDQLLKLGVVEQRIRVVHPGVDIERFKSGIESGDLRNSILHSRDQRLILSVGRLSRRKGFDQVIRSLQGLLARGLDVQYAIIGTGSDRDFLEALAERERVVGRVHFLGHVPAEDLPRWYNAADVVAMPNREIEGDTEGFGMVFIEAAACRKPTIAGQAGGTGAAVIHEVTGLRVDGASVEAVTAGLARVLADPSLSRRLAEGGYRRAIDEFSWESVAERIRALGTVG